jgi:hypothetical protein
VEPTRTDRSTRQKASRRARSTKSTRREGVTQLSIVLSGDEPPSEFCVFTAGTVETTKGTFTFDETASQSVMADYTAHGIDLMIDYDHASLASVTLDPALAGKAAGWFNIEVRNGELWAVNVRWTEPAAEALRRKEWRFMSPAFQTEDSGRVTGLLNVALTNIPATRKLQPLMAASVLTTLGASMDPKLISAALDALVAGDEAKCAELLKGIIASAAGAEPAEEEKPEEKPEPKPDPVAAAMPEEKPEEVAAALSAVRSLSGKASFVASVSDIRTWHTSHVELAAERTKLAEREAVLEGAERRKLCVELVTLAGRAPATVWATPDSQTPKAYLASMPIADLRAMHADEIKANGGKRGEIKPPPGGGEIAPAGGMIVTLANGATEALSARELAVCTEMKVEPKDYAARKAATKKKAG